MTTEFAGNYQGPLYAPHPDIKRNKMNSKQLQELKANYASLIVDGMDMKSLEQFAIEMVEENMKDWDEDDVKQEIIEYYGEETWNDMNDFSTESGQYSISDLEATAPDYGVGK